MGLKLYKHFNINIVIKINRVFKIITLLTLCILQSCSNDDCNESCFSPPTAFEFELVDKLTSENLFTNGTFNSNDIKIINLEDLSNVEFTFIDENEYNIIRVTKIGWKTETVNYSIEVSTEQIFQLFVNAERLSKNCCAYTEYKEIRIENTEYEWNPDSGIYKILVE